MTWLRLEEDIFDHPQIIGLSHGAQCLLIKLLCMTKRSGHGGFLSRSFVSDDYMMIKTREPIDQIKRWMDDLTQAGLIIWHERHVEVVNWRKYQIDPNACERMTRYREKNNEFENICNNRNERNSRNVTNVTTTGRDGTGRDGTGQAHRSASVRAKRSPRPVDDSFEQFWDAYPRKVARRVAEKAWLQTVGERPSIEDLLASIARHKTSEQWTRDAGAYIPHPATWLRGLRWRDEVVAATPMAAQYKTQQERQLDALREMIAKKESGDGNSRGNSEGGNAMGDDMAQISGDGGVDGDFDWGAS